MSFKINIYIFFFTIFFFHNARPMKNALKRGYVWKIIVEGARLEMRTYNRGIMKTEQINI